MKSLVMLACAVIALLGCSEQSGSVQTLAHTKAGLYESLPPGVAKVSGSCSGKLVMTPSNYAEVGFRNSYPLVYHCDKKKFEVLPVEDALEPGFSYGDLSLTDSGYYLHDFRSVDLVRLGGYTFYTRDGKKTARLERPDFDAHDLLVRPDSITYMAYVPDRDKVLCGGAPAVPIELEITEEDKAGKVLWKWSSKDKLKIEHDVSMVQRTARSKEEGWQVRFRPIRKCYTSLAQQLVSFSTPALFVLPGKWPVFQLDHNDYIHGNSIQYINDRKDVLVSARNFDTVFVIDRATGKVSWTLGGEKSLMSANKPGGDSKGGFSHQHSAHLEGDRLYIYDNAVNFPKRPSRAVVYKVNAGALADAVFDFEANEPNQKKRPALGYVRPLKNGRLLVGWGGLMPADRNQPQRAVSIFDRASSQEEFYIDFAPHWVTYRVKHYE